MKKIFIVIAFICFASSLFSQEQTLPVGKYFAINNGILLNLEVTKDGTFQIAMAEGQIETKLDGFELKFNTPNVPNFAITYGERGSKKDSITINFGDSFQSYYSNYVLIGSKQTARDSYNYVPVFDLINTQNPDGENISFVKVARTPYLSFLENQSFDGNNTAYNYSVPEDVNTIDLIYNLSSSTDLKLSAKYDPQNNAITVDNNGKNPMIFRTDYEKYIATFEKPDRIEQNVIYEGHDVEDFSGYENNDSNYKFKLQKFDDYKTALQKNKEEKKILVVYYLPDTPTATKDYEDFLKIYEQFITYEMYDGYKIDSDAYNFYLAKDSDKKLIKQFDLNQKSMVALVNDGDMIFKQNADFAKLKENFVAQDYILTNFRGMYVMKRLDNLATNKKFDVAEAQQVFFEISKLSSYAFYSGHSSIIDVDYMQDGYKETGAEFYRLKANQPAVDALYSKLIESHKNDAEVDFKFVDLISHNLSVSYNNILYKNETTALTTADLGAVDYLLKFKKEIQNYQTIEDPDNFNDSYYFYDIFPYTIETALRNGLDGVDKSKVQAIKIRLEKLYDNKTDYLSFLRTYVPEEFLSKYQETYNSYFNGNKDIILQLNDIYEASNNDGSWKDFKFQIASQANTAAWDVVENMSYKNLLADAIKWSKTSLEIDANNPYYLDTLAQLLYIKGEKQEAINTQEKAVSVIKNNSAEYDSSLLEDLESVLKSMRDGSYVQKDGAQE